MIKTIIYLLISTGFLLAISAKAQSPIAVANETSCAMYNTLDMAISNSADGDAIYLPGGNFSVSVPITKSVQIIGVGYRPDSCKVTGITQVVGTLTLKNGCNRGSITGINLVGGITFSTGPDENINNFIIERCNISGTVGLTANCTDVFITECVLTGGILGSGTRKFQMSKCIYAGNSVGSGFVSGSYFNNNIFLSATSVYSTECTFENNIFCGTVTSLGTNNLFNRNFSTTSVIPNSVVGDLNALFKNKTKAGFDYDQDYQILETSPAHLAGTDGTDLGIYGTENPWKEGSLPRNPHYQSIQITNHGGNLSSKIKVAAQDN